MRPFENEGVGIHMRDDTRETVRQEVVGSMVDHLATSGGALATPADPMAKLRREVLRGLRGHK